MALFRKSSGRLLVVHYFRNEALSTANYFCNKVSSYIFGSVPEYNAETEQWRNWEKCFQLF